jgi:hypothetical protein
MQPVPTSRSLRAVRDARWVTLAVAVAAVVVMIVGAVELTKSGRGGCRSNADCPATDPACDVATGKCGGCTSDADCPLTDPVCNVATGKCGGCRTGADCPATAPVCSATGACVECGHANPCPQGLECNAAGTCVNPCVKCDDPTKPVCDVLSKTCVKCDATHPCLDGLACDGGKCVAPCADPKCRTDQDCDLTVNKCVCHAGWTDTGQICIPPVSGNAINCQDVHAISDAALVPGQTDIRQCTGVAGVEPDLSGTASTTAPWSLDQVYLDQYDNPVQKPRSFPGNQTKGAFDSTRVSLTNVSGCYYDQQDGDSTGTNNCSRGLRLSSLWIGAGAAPAGYGETRNIGSWQAVGDTFLAHHKIWGKGGAGQWSSSGAHAGNIYPRKNAAGDGFDAVRLRCTGDLWGVEQPAVVDGKIQVPQSSDLVPFTPGLYQINSEDQCTSPDPLDPGGCGGTKWTCGDSGKCSKVHPPPSCLQNVDPSATNLQPTCLSSAERGTGGGDACLLGTRCDGFKERVFDDTPPEASGGAVAATAVCTTDADCTTDALAECGAAKQCVPCTGNAACANHSSGAVCTAGTCGPACTTDADCKTPALAQCDAATQKCVACTGNLACAGQKGKTTCTAGACVATPPGNPAFDPEVAWNTGATVEKPNPAGLLTTDQRRTFARCGGCLVTQDMWGPGQYEFVLKVPPTPHAYDDAVDTTLPNPNVDIDKNCLSGYVFAIWLFTETELYTVFEPFDPSKGRAAEASGPAPDPSNAPGPASASGAALSDGTNSCGRNISNVCFDGDGTPCGRTPHVEGGPVCACAVDKPDFKCGDTDSGDNNVCCCAKITDTTGVWDGVRKCYPRLPPPPPPVPWRPSEQATWSGKTTNTCEGNDFQNAPPTYVDLDTETALVTPIKDANGVDGGLSFWAPHTPAAKNPLVNWAELTKPTCVPNNDQMAGGGGQGASQGGQSQEEGGSLTYRLLGCEDPTCTTDADCAWSTPDGGAVPLFTCQKPVDKSYCLPDKSNNPDLNAQLAALYAQPAANVQTNCLAFQQKWQTGLFGAKWCGTKHSLSSAPCVEGLNAARWRRSGANAVQGAVHPDGAVDPEIPYFVQSAELGGSIDDGDWGGDNIFGVLNHEIDFEIPCNTPSTKLTADRAGGAYGPETINLNTWLGDNNSYTPAGPTPWYTQAMVTYDWPTIAASSTTGAVSNLAPWPKKGITKAACDSEFRAQRTFMSKVDTTPGAKPDWGQKVAYRPVTYKIDWWADEDPTKSYVRFIVDDKLIYSTSRFVPTHGGRWIIGPWPARWGGGYRPKAGGGMQSNSQAWDYVYCDLLSASFKPYTVDHVPPGLSLKCLKLRAVANTYDQALKGVAEALVEGDPNVLKRAPGGADTAWAGMTCEAGTGGYDCEIRCGIHELVDWSSTLKSLFPDSTYTRSTISPVACTQDPMHLGICPDGPLLGGGAAGGAAARAVGTSETKPWLAVTIAMACVAAVLIGLTAWLFVWAKKTTKAAPSKTAKPAPAAPSKTAKPAPAAPSKTAKPAPAGQFAVVPLPV